MVVLVVMMVVEIMEVIVAVLDSRPLTPCPFFFSLFISSETGTNFHSLKTSFFVVFFLFLLRIGVLESHKNRKRLLCTNKTHSFCLFVFFNIYFSNSHE